MLFSSFEIMPSIVYNICNSDFTTPVVFFVTSQSMIPFCVHFTSIFLLCLLQISQLMIHSLFE